MGVVGTVTPPVTLAEAQAYLRVETGEEEALIAGLVRTATMLCEAFINQVITVREFSEELAAPRTAWQRLSATPVRSIAQVDAIASDGAILPVRAQDYAVDIDASGDGWVRADVPPGASRLRVTGSAGMADGPNGVPEPIRQGILRLVAHMFNTRDGAGGEPPAAVTALWRPYRRARLV